MRRIKDLEISPVRTNLKSWSGLVERERRLQGDPITILKHIEGYFRKEGINLFFQPTFARKSAKIVVST